MQVPDVKWHTVGFCPSLSLTQTRTHTLLPQPFRYTLDELRKIQVQYNPREIYERAPVIPLMTSLMKVTSLQKSGSGSVAVPYRGRLARGDKLNTFLTGNSSLRRLASWLCGDTHQD